MQKAIKASSRIFDKVSAIDDDDLSAKQKKAKYDLGASLEAAEVSKDELGFMLKFKKNKSDGACISVSSAQTMQKTCAQTLLEMLDSCKVVKSMLPKPKEEA